MEEKYSGKGKNQLQFSLPARTSLIKFIAKLFLVWSGRGRVPVCREHFSEHQAS